MNKVTCNVCGTSYPENASQCPICGFARTTEAAGEHTESSYTYVKGGRFSKANVRKRNQSNNKEISAVATVAEKNSSEKSSVGSVIVIIVLLLAIIAVVGYIALRFFLPNDYIFEGLNNFTLPSFSQEEKDDPAEESNDEPILSDDDEDVEDDEQIDTAKCTAVSLNETQVTFTAAGETYELIVNLEPVDTTDELFFSSSDDAVASVDEYGLITAVSEGNAVITVTCGDISAECSVVCTIAPTVEPLTLNRKEITFEEEGQSWVLYDGTLDPSQILWSSDDNTVATIENGKVVAVGSGDTTVYGIYNGTTASCIIHCKLDAEETGTKDNVSEADGDTKRTYKLYNPYGRADDVTIKVGQKFPLTLVDEDKKEVTDVTWKVEKSKVCSYKNGTVKGLAAGTSKVTATYDGVTYTCIVRVK